MSHVQRTDIEWCDYSANPIKFTHPDVGGGTRPINLCVPCSSGCANCYAAAITRRFQGVTYTAQTMRQATLVMDEQCLQHMLRFQPPGPFKHGSQRPKVFVGDMTDVFGAWVPDEILDRMFAVFALRPDVDWLILTKRPERMAEYFVPIGGTTRRDWVWSQMARQTKRSDQAGPYNWPLPNVWLGTSVENQATADERIAHLLRCPAAVRLLSCEPLLGAVDLMLDGECAAWACPECGSRNVDPHGGMGGDDMTTWLCPDCGDVGVGEDADSTSLIDWVIVGGESGPGARPMHPDWARSLRDQCAAAGVPCFFKQWGEYAPVGPEEDLPDSVFKRGPGHDGRVWRVGKKAAGRLLDGVEHNAMPQIGGGE